MREQDGTNLISMGELVTDLALDDRMSLHTGVGSQDEVWEVRHSEHWPENALHRRDRSLSISKPESSLLTVLTLIHRIEDCCFQTLVSDLDSSDTNLLKSAICFHL